MIHFKTRKKNTIFGGFTLIEIIIVIVILAIAAVIAVPMFSSAAGMQVRSAANRIAADLDYAKGLAVTYQKPYTVVFRSSSESYDIRDTTTDTVVDDPVNPGSYVIDFTKDSNFDRVNIVNADFDSDATNAITFDYLGSPYHGKSTDSADALNSGRITLQADSLTIYVDVEPVTGYVTISAP